MVRNEISAEVLSFLDNCIDSVEQLRVLLLLHSEPERLWTIAEMTAELRSAESSIAQRLEGLYGRQVLNRLPESRDRHKFSPGNMEIRSIVAQLANENRVRPYRLIELIYSQPNKALRDFADAFKFRGGKS